MIENYVTWFKSLDLYKDYVYKLPEPLNSPELVSGLSVILMFFLGISVIDHIKSWRVRRKIRKIKEAEDLRRAEDERRRREEEEQRRTREAEQNKQKMDTDEYIRFMTVVQMQNMASLQGLTFDQWRVNRNSFTDGLTKEANHVQDDKEKQENPVCLEEQSQSQEKEKELEQKYWTDSVTGLHTRAAYESDLAKVDIYTLGVVSIDANDLKKTNDTFGHEAGDALLKGIADTMCDVWGIEKCYRIGGDEFAVILSSVRKRVTEKNIQTFKELLEDGNLSAAAGYADFSDVKGKVSANAIKKLSDVAMYSDKRAFKQARADAEESARKAEEERLKEEQKRLEKEQQRIEEERIKAEQEKDQEEKEQARIEAERVKEEEKTKQEELLKNIASVDLKDNYDNTVSEPELDLPTILDIISEPVVEEESIDVKEVLQTIIHDIAPDEGPAYSTETSLTDEQQSDFAKALALLQAQNVQKEQLDAYNQKRSEITKKNIEVLDKTLEKETQTTAENKSKAVSSNDEIEKRKRAAVAAIESEEKAKQEGKKKGLFNKKK